MRLVCVDVVHASFLVVEKDKGHVKMEFGDF